MLLLSACCVYILCFYSTTVLNWHHWSLQITWSILDKFIFITIFFLKIFRRILKQFLRKKILSIFSMFLIFLKNSVFWLQISESSDFFHFKKCDKFLIFLFCFLLVCDGRWCLYDVIFCHLYSSTVCSSNCGATRRFAVNSWINSRFCPSVGLQLSDGFDVPTLLLETGVLTWLSCWEEQWSVAPTPTLDPDPRLKLWRVQLWTHLYDTCEMRNKVCAQRLSSTYMLPVWEHLKMLKRDYL